MTLLRLSFTTLGILVALSACGTLFLKHVGIENEPIYFLKQASDQEWATLMYFLTDGKSPVSREEWDKVSQGMVCMPLKSFADFNKEIGKLCSEVPCDYDTQVHWENLIKKLEVESGRSLR